MQRTILVVDDEVDILNIVAFCLTKAGYRVMTAESAELALKIIAESRPDLVILDVMLPGIDGHRLCSILKNPENKVEIPILIISARGDEADVIEGFNRGGDDYVQKPFSPRVLEARVRSLLRRFYLEPHDDLRVLQSGPFYIDPRRFDCSVDQVPVSLTSTEFRILYLLLARQGQVIGRNAIVSQVHGSDYPVTERSIDVQIVGLRKKLGHSASWIETVRGVGYRLRPLDEGSSVKR
jgi:two-component system alkaline phosphatase synthesis response regulator PhoP